MFLKQQDLNKLPVELQMARNNILREKKKIMRNPNESDGIKKSIRANL